MAPDQHVPANALGKTSRISLDGRRSERSVILADGSMHSLTLLHPGIYALNSDGAETIRVLSGMAYYHAEGSNDVQELHAGDSMVIPANQSYRLEVVEALDYLLSS
ncbi:pyrimidine/purine nucleoside phosphorylase [Acidithiobacillus sp.]|jgi:hypothetical protein|uniref:pyrimidine/purine nucleoside phosphorylase n=1 Tax=Acidithiobacillus sp. TaxID=1872118 RepID=UPI00262C4090|nr:pyrimidine/purine nucleoside phosphorylase [Acidithiobacillus sp.]